MESRDALAELRIYTIYDSPADCPGHFVVRISRVTKEGTRTCDKQVFLSLAEARAAIPPHLYCFTRHLDDDPVIVETWM